MYHYVYILKTLDGYLNKTYVGYSIDVNSRLKKHNSSKGAKATRGYKWKIIYKKRFMSKSEALSFEYLLKKDRKKRSSILKRIKLHNNGKGAKFTRGRKWILAYKKCYKTKSKALKNEYLLKKNYKKRGEIKNKFLLKK